MPTPTAPAAPAPIYPGANALAARIVEVLIGELVCDADRAASVAGAGLRSRTWLVQGTDGLPQLVLA